MSNSNDSGEGVVEPPVVELSVVKDEPPIRRLTLDGDRAMLGRAPSNDLVFSDSRISWHHALLWTEGGSIWLRDLGSTNGTFVDNEALKEPTLISDGAHVSLGKAADIFIRRTGTGAAAPQLVLEDLDNRLVFPLLSDRFVIGTGPESDLRIEDAAGDSSATLMIYENHEVWLGVDAVAIPIEIGRPFEVAERQMRIREIRDGHATTEIASVFRYPYQLTITFSASVPQAVLEDSLRGTRCDISAENRVALMYVLAQKLRDDRAASVSPSREGWCNDQEVGVSVWGRSWHEQTSNNLHVILHRLRKQLKNSGLDPWCIEKKRGKIRLRIQDVTIG
ncbi:MAG: FHA domain-containing protein [Myxococcota bacterium]